MFKYYIKIKSKLNFIIYKIISYTKIIPTKVNPTKTLIMKKESIFFSLIVISLMCWIAQSVEYSEDIYNEEGTKYDRVTLKSCPR